jgi:hypothetical protein
MGNSFLGIIAFTVFVNVALILSGATERRIRRLRLKMKKKLRL